MTSPTETPEDVRDVPVRPFGATVRGALALLPDTDLAEARPPAGSTPGTPRGNIVRTVTAEQARDWTGELTARVALRLDGWTRLPGEVRPEEVDLSPLPDRDQLVLEARRLIHSGVASYIEAARSRGGNAPTTEPTSYAAVLWSRFEDGLDDLTGWFVGRLISADPSTPETPGEGAAGLPVGRFPAPSIGMNTGF